MIFVNILIFVLIIGFLVFIHEFFHFLAAKRIHAKVEEFCIGYPPRAYKKKVGETLYSIGIIPFGGFVKIFGEDPNEKGKGSFYSKPIWQRFQVMAAGVFSNFLIAIILFSLVFWMGYPQAIEGKTPKNVRNLNVQIIFVAKNSPAEKAGLLIGDKIMSLSSKEKFIHPKEIEDVQKFANENTGEEITITAQRGKNIINKKVEPRENPPKNEGPVGIMLAKTGIIKYSLPESVAMGFEVSYRYTKLTIWAIGKMAKNAITRTSTPGLEFSGPIGAGNYFVKLADLGSVYIIYFMAVLSLGLAILNSLPFPALDGGRILFLGIEKVKKSPVKPEIENYVNQAGFVLLIILMVVITIKDIKNLL